MVATLREFNHSTDLALGSSPCSNRPYRMSKVEQDEINNQVSNLLGKGYVKPSISPYVHRFQGVK